MLKQESKSNGLHTRTDKVFDSISTTVLVLLALVCLYPIYYTIIASFSDPNLVITGQVYLTIKDFTLESYQEVMRYKSVFTGYRNSIIYTVLATLWSLLVMIPAAYALSKRQLKGRKILMFFFMFTMYFSGGMIPTYLLLKNLGLINNPLVLIIPNAVSVYNMLITRTFFECNFSESLAESARIDGASELRIFLQIALPLSGAIIAVMTLYHGVMNWNSYFSALLYIRDGDYYPLQLIMHQILNTSQNSMAGNPGKMSLSSEAMVEMVRRQRAAYTMRYALVILANIPVLVVYPFVSKHFVRGVMIGAVKG